MSLLSLRNVSKAYAETGFLGRTVATTPALEDASLSLDRGEALGLVGESGAGKSTLARVAAGLDAPSAGAVRFDGVPMADADRTRVGFVFQRPTGSFDPRMEVVDSVAEPLRVAGVEREPARERARDALERVGVEGVAAYPHELSGGQTARAALARAVVSDPDLLVLDEPTSALDPGVQADVLALLDDLRRDLDLALLLVAHDLRVVRSVCERAVVLYAGETVAKGPLPAVLDDPAHPYAAALTDAETPLAPSAEPDSDLPADPADAAEAPDGCRFHPRCPAVVLPEGYDGDREGFRAVLRLRRALSEGLDVGADSTGDLRRRFGVPADLGDDQAERCLAAALDHAVAGERRAAAALLGRVFETPCERTNPSLRAVGEQEAACLRADDFA